MLTDARVLRLAVPLGVRVVGTAALIATLARALRRATLSLVARVSLVAGVSHVITFVVAARRDHVRGALQALERSAVFSLHRLAPLAALLQRPAERLGAVALVGGVTLVVGALWLGVVSKRRGGGRAVGRRP